MSLQPFLQDLPFLSAYYVGRVPGMQFPADRQEALKAQIPFFKKTARELFPAAKSFFCAQEVHGTEIAILRGSEPQQDLIPNIDGMITNGPGIVLGITFADCAPVWIVDSQRKAVALVHSGRRGTEAGIVPKAIQLLQAKFASQPKDLIVTIGPCIRPPCYEVDFAKTIREQAAQAGVGEIRDEGICTACDLEKYYSYRREKGKTGHMLGLVMLRSN
ncbi:MAG: polyphenol oxidase family protein [Chthoniobacterales bacterium]|nr:polyphenol oxidase family protein [Chthoniobacterales bacterium]